jgi:hypothetical protein
LAATLFATTSIGTESVSLLLPRVIINVAESVPTNENLTLFTVFPVASSGVPPLNIHLGLVNVPVDVFTNVTGVFSQTETACVGDAILLFMVNRICCVKPLLQHTNSRTQNNILSRFLIIGGFKPG